VVEAAFGVLDSLDPARAEQLLDAAGERRVW
jgi:hypothetical protein